MTSVYHNALSIWGENVPIVAPKSTIEMNSNLPPIKPLLVHRCITHLWIYTPMVDQTRMANENRKSESLWYCCNIQLSLQWIINVQIFNFYYMQYDISTQIFICICQRKYSIIVFSRVNSYHINFQLLITVVKKNRNHHTNHFSQHKKKS